VKAIDTGLRLLRELQRHIDSGTSWHVSFRGTFQQAAQFQATVGCASQTAWVLFNGPGQAMNQRPYVLYVTRDGGTHWQAVMEEGYFGSLYPNAHAHRNLGSFTGPFDIVSPRAAVFLGTTVPIGIHGVVEFSRTINAGRTWQQRKLPCLYALGELDLHFTSAQRGWVVGDCNGRAAILTTRDGGRTWTRHALLGPAGHRAIQ